MDYDPLLAQEVESALGDLPDDMLNALLAMAKGNPLRARTVLDKLNAVWWHRWLAMMEQRAKAEDSAKG